MIFQLSRQRIRQQRLQKQIRRQQETAFLHRRKRKKTKEERKVLEAKAEKVAKKEDAQKYESAWARVEAELREILKPIHRNCASGIETSYAEYQAVRIELNYYLWSLGAEEKHMAASIISGDRGGGGWMKLNMSDPYRGLSGEYAAAFLDARKSGNTASLNSLEKMRKLLFEGLGYVAGDWISKTGSMDARGNYWNGPYFDANDCMYDPMKRYFRLYRNVLNPDQRDNLGLNDMHKTDGKYQPDLKYEYYDSVELVMRWNAENGKYENHQRINFLTGKIEKAGKSRTGWVPAAYNVDWFAGRADASLDCYGMPVGFAISRRFDRVVRQMGTGQFEKLSWKEKQDILTGNSAHALVFVTKLFWTGSRAASSAIPGDITYVGFSPHNTGNGHSGTYGRAKNGKLAVYNLKGSRDFMEYRPPYFYRNGGIKKLYRPAGVYMRGGFGMALSAPQKPPERKEKADAPSNQEKKTSQVLKPDDLLKSKMPIVAPPLKIKGAQAKPADKKEEGKKVPDREKETIRQKVKEYADLASDVAVEARKDRKRWADYWRYQNLSDWLKSGAISLADLLKTEAKLKLQGKPVAEARKTEAAKEKKKEEAKQAERKTEEAKAPEKKIAEAKPAERKIDTPAAITQKEMIAERRKLWARASEIEARLERGGMARAEIKRLKAEYSRLEKEVAKINAKLKKARYARLEDVLESIPAKKTVTMDIDIEGKA